MEGDNQKKKKKIYYMSIDIEATGDSYFSTINSLGAAFGPASGTQPKNLFRFRADMKPLPGAIDEEDCIENFWKLKAYAVWLEIQANAIDPKEAMRRFLSFCQQMVAFFEDNPDPAECGEIVILSDCPDFDVGRLQYHAEVATATWTVPIRSLGKAGTRHNLLNPKAWIKTPEEKQEWEDWRKRNVPDVVHDHRPDNDATYTYYQMIFVDLKGKDLPK
jgi:hypothetical protein